jgi:glutathione synthase/RimK-type ligase-like ATP-grasp enzyme
MVLIISKQSADEYESTRLLQTFAERNIDVMLAHPDDFDIIVNQNLNKGIKYKGESFEMPKLVLVRFGAGILPFQLAVIRHFEQAGIPCINSSDAIELVKDKLRTSQILSKEKIAIPNTMMVRFPIDDGLVEKHIGFPCVVKVVTGSYGEGVYLCEKKRDYRKLMEFIDSLGNKKTMIVQEYLGDHPGEDLRVLVVGGEVIGAMKRTAPEGDFRANITNGGTGSKYELTDEIRDIARKTALTLGLNIAGIDLLFDKRGFRVCEANSNPGFNGFDTYCDFDVAGIIVDYIESILTKRKK